MFAVGGVGDKSTGGSTGVSTIGRGVRAGKDGCSVAAAGVGSCSVAGGAVRAGSDAGAIVSGGGWILVAVIHAVRAPFAGVECLGVVTAANTPIATKLKASAALEHTMNDTRLAMRRDAAAALTAGAAATGYREVRMSMFILRVVLGARAAARTVHISEFIGDTMAKGDRQDERPGASDGRWFATMDSVST